MTRSKIAYEGMMVIDDSVDQNENMRTPADELYQTNFDKTMVSLLEKKVCPFYYYLHLLKSSNSPDIVICTYKDFFDLKARIQVSRLITKEFKIIFDECNDIDRIFTDMYTKILDDDLLFHSNIQLFYIREKIEKIKNEALECKSNGIIGNVELSDSYLHTEKEFLMYNELGNNKAIIQSSDKFPGAIRKPTHFLNLVSRLLVLFNKLLSSKPEGVYNTYALQYYLLKELWIDFRSLKPLFRRLLALLDDIHFLDYQEIYHLVNFIFFVNYLALFNEGFIINSYKYLNSEKFFLEFFLIEPYLIFHNALREFSKPPVLLTGGVGNLEIFEKLFKFPNPIISKSYVDDRAASTIYLTSISNTNANNNTFYGEILMKLCKCVPDGILCYFSSISLMEYYIQRWNEQGVFDYIMDDKLIFIEEQDSQRLSTIIANYKKACTLGRGGLFFLTTRNKASFFDDMTQYLSRCIIFIGFPYESKITKTFELRMENYKKNFGIGLKFLDFEAFNLFSQKIAGKISDANDKKILVLLDEKLISEKLKDYLPSWLNKIIHIDYDKENANTDERLKNIKRFLDD